MYVALLSLFAHLLLRAHDAGSTAGRVAFGFLAALFAAGLIVSLVKTIGALRGSGGGAHQSATN